MGYRTEPKAEMHGIRVSTIKKLLRRPFNTHDACIITGLEDPEVSQFLRLLEKDEILDYIGVSEGFEHWDSGALGDHIKRSRIQKPKKVSEALKILNQIIERAGEIANDQSYLYFPTEIWLFGSTLRGGDQNSLVGDLDIAIDFKKRGQGNSLQKLTIKERRLMLIEPEKSEFNRMIKKLNPTPSFANIQTLQTAIDIDAQRQRLWHYDPHTKSENHSPSPIVGSSTSSDVPPSKRDENYIPPPSLILDRKPPKPTGIIPYIWRLTKQARAAKNTWIRGASIKQICEALECEEAEAKALLQWCPSKDLKASYEEVCAIGEPAITFTLPSGSINITIPSIPSKPEVFVTDQVRMRDNSIMEGAYLAPLMHLATALEKAIPRNWGVSDPLRILLTIEPESFYGQAIPYIPIKEIREHAHAHVTPALNRNPERDRITVTYDYDPSVGFVTITGEGHEPKKGGRFFEETMVPLFCEKIEPPEALAQIPACLTCYSVRLSEVRDDHDDD